MKKILTALLIASMLLFTLGTVALAGHVEDVPPETIQPFRSGSVPAAQAPDSAGQVLHAAVLSMLSRDASSFAGCGRAASWEALYNLLSLYGQMDNRSQYRDESLIFPAETLADYAAALGLDVGALGTLPADLADRMTYLPQEDSYLAACGSDSLAEIQILSQEGNQLTGALVYLVDNTRLAQFTATLQPADNLFGCTLVELELL